MDCLSCTSHYCPSNSVWPPLSSRGSPQGGCKPPSYCFAFLGIALVGLSLKHSFIFTISLLGFLSNRQPLPPISLFGFCYWSFVIASSLSKVWISWQHFHQILLSSMIFIVTDRSDWVKVHSFWGAIMLFSIPLAWRFFEKGPFGFGNIHWLWPIFSILSQGWNSTFYYLRRAHWLCSTYHFDFCPASQYKHSS